MQEIVQQVQVVGDTLKLRKEISRDKLFNKVIKVTDFYLRNYENKRAIGKSSLQIGLHDFIKRLSKSEKSTRIKITSFLSSLLQQQDIPKIKLFSKILGLSHFSEMESEENNFIFLRKKLFIGEQGSRLKSIIVKENEYLQWENVKRYLKETFEPSLRKKIYENLKDHFIQRKIIDKHKNENKVKYVDVDIAMMSIIDTQKIVKAENQDLLKIIFEAQDINKNEFISTREFKILHRAIEGEILESRNEDIRDYMSKISASNSEECKIGLKTDQFIEISSLLGLFNMHKTLGYLDITEKQLEKPKSKLVSKIFRIGISDLEDLKNKSMSLKTVPEGQRKVYSDTIEELIEYYKTQKQSEKGEMLFNLLRAKFLHSRIMVLYFRERLNKSDIAELTKTDDLLDAQEDVQEVQVFKK